MSFLLALETSSKLLSFALFKENVLIAEKIYPPDLYSHSEKLMPFLDSFLKENHLSLKHIQVIALSAGPGAYTSLRVGMATAMGLSLVSGMRVYGVSTLKAQACVETTSQFLAPLLKAGRGKIYAALLKKKGDFFDEVLPEGVYDPENFFRLAQSPSVLFLPATDELAHLVPQNASHRITPPTASQVGHLVIQQKSSLLPLQNFAIRYLQEPDLGRK